LHISFVTPSSLRCRDAKDQIFLDLCASAAADVLVTGDADLLSLAHLAEFAIETPEAYRLRFGA
jgi:predicted nucleic acid-binding protein